VSGASRQLLYGQLCFFGFLILCGLVDGAGFSGNHGFSYYGGHAETIVPYGLAFGSLCFFVARAALLVGPGPLAPALRGLVVLLVLDVATPDTINAAFYWGHVAASTLLFLYALALAAWLARDTLTGALLAVQFVAGLIAMFSQMQLISALSIGILAFQLTFGTLLVIATNEVREAAVATT
jgi:hypothetical protein